MIVGQFGPLGRPYVESRLIIPRLQVKSGAYPNETNESLPSLLGRNVINHWYIQYDPANDRLEFTVRHADRTIVR